MISDFVQSIGFLAAICTTIAFLPQAWKIYKTKSNREPRHPGHVRRDHGEPGEQHHHHVLGVTQSQPGILFFLKAFDMQRS